MVCRVLVLGSSNVGKTTMLQSLSGFLIPDPFEKITIEYKNTILHFQDTSGDQEWDRLRPISYSNASVILLCFSLVSDISFVDIVERWIPEISCYLPQVPVILVATHSDQSSNSKLFEQGILISEQINALNYVKIQSHRIDPDHLLPIIISSAAPHFNGKDYDDTDSSCDSDLSRKSRIVIENVGQVHESDDETRIEDELVIDNNIVEELNIPPVPKKSVQGKPMYHGDHKKKKRGLKLFKKRQDKDCVVMRRVVILITMISFDQLLVLCAIGWFIAIIPVVWSIIDMLRDRYIASRGYSQISSEDDIEIPQDTDEISILKHFRNSVSAVIQLADISPESKDLKSLEKTVKSESFRKTIKRKASLPKMKSILSRKSNSSLKKKTSIGSIAMFKKMIDRSFCFAEHVHEWSLSHIGKVKFVDHAPLVFQSIRKRLGYTCKSLLASLDKQLSFFDSEGKSEALFFVTEDRKFLFKTLRGAEPSNLKAFLQDYLLYISKESNTLLPRILGFYTFERLSRGSDAISTSGISSGTLKSVDMIIPPKFTIIMMANVFGHGLDINFKFDFKGSQLGRETLSSNEKISYPVYETLKELDFQRMVQNGSISRLNISAGRKNEFLAQLSRDVELLKSYGFIDYSLLVGIHQHHFNSNSSTGSPSAPSSGSTTPKSDIQSKISILDSNILTSAWKLWSRSSSDKSNGSPLPFEFSDLPSMWIDEQEDDELECSFFGGVRSNQLSGPVEFEVYYFGLIDILQKYNMAKWFERGIKKQKTQFFGRETPSLSQIFASQPNDPKTYPSPLGSPPEVSVSLSKERESWISNSSDMISMMGEPSVEEPIRYATRICEFVESIFQ